MNVLEFRIDRYDASGNRLAPIPVQMQHHRSGQLSEGDEIEAAGTWTDGTLVVSRIANVTTGAEITGWVPNYKPFLIGCATVIALAVVGLAVFALVVRDKVDDVKDRVDNAGRVLPRGGVQAGPFQPGPTNPDGTPADDPNAEVTVPDVVGLSSVQAHSKLREAGLFPKGEFEKSPTVRFGDVIRTDPAAGTKVARDSRVVFYTSTGAD